MTEITKLRKITLGLSACFLYTVWGLLISLQPPFYPSEAEDKGATPSQYGFVFGIANLAAFLTAPFFGRYGYLVGPKILYNVGAYVQAAWAIAFGFLDYIDNVSVFLGLSYFLRFVGGTADAATWGSVVSILMKIFPEHTHKIASVTEMAFGLGFMLGPALGSFLYEVGGFVAPFATVGSLAFVMAVILSFVVPNVKTDPVKGDSKSLTFAALVKHPSIFMPFVDNFICFSGNGLIESMLEPYMKKYAGATQMDVGVTFLILGGLYMCSSLAMGIICDKIKYPSIVSVLGNMTIATAFMLFGPLSFITPLTTSVGLIKGAAAVLGSGNAMVMVSTFGRCQTAAVRNGYEKSLNTTMFISSMWASSFFLGSFLGPTVGGIIVDNFGFQKTTLGFFVLFCANTIVDLTELFYNVRINSNKEETKNDAVTKTGKEVDVESTKF